eukprot:446505-Rhodomonas_salina.3
MLLFMAAENAAVYGSGRREEASARGAAGSVRLLCYRVVVLRCRSARMVLQGAGGDGDTPRGLVRRGRGAKSNAKDCAHGTKCTDTVWFCI